MISKYGPFIQDEERKEMNRENNEYYLKTINNFYEVFEKFSDIE